MHRNSEHYPNPTFSGAYFQIRRDEKIIKRGERFIPWVYIASPYRGNIEKNTDNARRYSLFAVQCGKLPFCPHIYFTQFLNDSIKNRTQTRLDACLAYAKTMYGNVGVRRVYFKWNAARNPCGKKVEYTDKVF